MHNHCVVLTCTVYPHSDVAVARIDPEVRLNDYITSITKWHKLSRKMNFKILVLENSNSIELIKSGLPTSVVKDISFHQCDSDSVSRKNGISSGEFAMLKESISILNKIENIEFCWKVTGRLFVNNFTKLTKNAGKEMWVNRFYKPRHIIDTRFFGIPLKMYSEVFSMNINFALSKGFHRSLILENDNFQTIEDFLTRICFEIEAIGWRVESFYKIPIFEGVSASTGKKLDNWDTIIRIKLANAIRKIAVKMISGSLP